MRLLRCHVDGFGCLSGYDRSFSPTVTVIREENGFGKTTLSNFLAAMLYGLPNGGTSDKNLRKKYAPWQGGSFGGWLEYETGGRAYRIVRRFGTRSVTGDSFALYSVPEMQSVDDLPPDIGQAVFGLSESSFRRCVCMDSGAVGSFSSADVQARLSRLVEDTNDINNLDTALERLREARKERMAFRGNSGSVSRLDAAAAEKQMEKARLEQSMTRLETLLGGQEDGRKRAEALRREIRALPGEKPARRSSALLWPALACFAASGVVYYVNCSPIPGIVAAAAGAVFLLLAIHHNRKNRSALAQWEKCVARQEALEAEENKLRDVLAAGEQSIRLLRQECDRLPEVTAELASLQRRRQEERDTCRLLDKTMELLSAAAEDLGDRYLHKLRESFQRNLEQMGMDDGTCLLDNRLEPAREVNGEPRSAASESSGNGTVLMLCMRLALCDALVDGERPFLLLDDPFTELDDRHMDKARQLLRSKAEQYQILYMTCHSSREI